MRKRWEKFIEQVRDAPTDAHAEKIVRYMLEEVAKDCPMWILCRLAQVLVDCRKEELRGEAECN